MEQKTIALENISFKGIECEDSIYSKLEHPVAKTLYLYLKEAKPNKITIDSLQEQIIRSKSAALRILMIIATSELENIGFLKDSRHKNDRIEFIYA